MSAENKVGTGGPSSCRGMQVAISPGDNNSNLVSCPGSSSPESSRSLSSLSDGDTSSLLNVNMLQWSHSDCSLMDNSNDSQSVNNSTPVDAVLSGMDINLNQNFIISSIDSDVDIANATNRQLRSSQDASYEEDRSGAKYTNTTTDGIMLMSPDSLEGESSGETSHRGSCDGKHCLSPEEMMMRSNSFCLEDISPPKLSFLESSNSLAISSPSSLPDFCEVLPGQSSTEGAAGTTFDMSCLDKTFIQASYAEAEDAAVFDCPVALPSEEHEHLLRTFLCEPDPYTTGAISPVPTEILPSVSAVLTPEEAMSSRVPASQQQDANDFARTSTPLFNSKNTIFKIPSLSGSSCTDSPAVCSVKDHRISGTPNRRLVARLPPSVSRISKTQIKTFPQPDFSHVKPKIMTRSVNNLPMAGQMPVKATTRKLQVIAPSKLSKVYKSRPIQIAPSGKMNITVDISSVTNDSESEHVREVNEGTHGMGTTFNRSDDENLCAPAESPARPVGETENGEAEGRVSRPDHVLTGSEPTASVVCTQASYQTEQVASIPAADTAAQCWGTQPLYSSSPLETPDRRHQTGPRSLKKGEESTRNGVRTGPLTRQGVSPVLKMSPRCSSETSSPSRQPRETQPCSSSSFSLSPKAHNPQSKTSAHGKQAKQCEATKATPETRRRTVRKISLVTPSPKSPAAGAAGATCEESQSRLGGRPSPGQARGAPASQPQAPSLGPKPGPPSTRPRPGGVRDGCGASMGTSTLQPRQGNTAANQRTRTSGAPAGTDRSASGSVRPQGNGPRFSHIPTRPSTSRSSSAAPRLPHKAEFPTRSVVPKTSLHSEPGSSKGAIQVSGGAAHGPTGTANTFRAAVLKARLLNSQGKSPGPAFATGSNDPTSTNQGASRTTVSPLKRTASSRLVRPNLFLAVDKNKPKASARGQPQQQPAQPPRSDRHPCQLPADDRTTGAEDYKAQCDRKDHIIVQLKRLLTAGSRKFEAIIVVLQQTLAERDEAMRQRRDLSQELVTLKGELVSSAHSCERLEKEKEEVQTALQDMLHKLKEQHQSDLAELEQRLQDFYQAEWDKAHLSFQEEANKCKELMEQQLAELQVHHEAMKQELEAKHSEQLAHVKQQCEDSVEELQKAQSHKLQTLDNTMKETEASLTGMIQDLTAENKALTEKLKAEDDRRRELAEKNQKDSHTLYLEQELESLKVVLDIKNKQLHQQDKKLMQLDKLTEKNVKLDECLKKVQQENEDLKARMDRHAALSRQLSTEQAVLQESLHKESKVNKRLSMENEELMWKLHNGDLSSPRKLSPTSTSPSHSLSFQSPRSSAFLSSPPVSPR